MAKYLIYLRLLVGLTQIFLPQDKNNFESRLGMRFCLDYLIFASGNGTEIIVSTIVIFAELMLFKPLFFD